MKIAAARIIVGQPQIRPNIWVALHFLYLIPKKYNWIKIKGGWDWKYYRKCESKYSTLGIMSSHIIDSILNIRNAEYIVVILNISNYILSRGRHISAWILPYLFTIFFLFFCYESKILFYYFFSPNRRRKKFRKKKRGEGHGSKLE